MLLVRTKYILTVESSNASYSATAWVPYLLSHMVLSSAAVWPQ
jgi:hypothetical protein